MFNPPLTSESLDAYRECVAFTIDVERSAKTAASALGTRTIKQRFSAMMRLLQLKKEEVSISFIDDAEMRILNRDYRKKDRPTDVLAFPLREGAYAEHAGNLLGDIVISLETAQKQAQAARKTTLDEVTMLLAHGLLHLLGWDHDTDAKDRAMRAETARLCAAAKAASSASQAPRGKARLTKGVERTNPEKTAKNAKKKSTRKVNTEQGKRPTRSPSKGLPTRKK